MKRNAFARLSFFLLLSALGCGALLAEDLKAILEKIDSVNRFADTYSAILRIASYSPEDPVALSSYRMYSKGMRKSLLVFIEPAKDAGKKIAMNGDSMWLYFPKARQSIIVRPVSTLTGSVAVGDMIGAPLLELYDFSESRPTEDGKGLALSFLAKGPESPYGKLVYEYRGGRIRGQLAYARSGTLLKKIDFVEYAQSAEGYEYATKIKVLNAVYPDYYSLIQISDLKKTKDFPDYYFTPEGLADAGTKIP
jgi:outer membrane lipoprotein-sorting protein